jgi:hydrogenase maturation protein HypF
VSELFRTEVRVEGVVQGVGFRPFVYSLATSLGLGGHVGNDVDGVFAEVEGSAEAVSEFLDRLRRQAPPLARIDRLVARPLPPTGSRAFAIASSPVGGGRRALVTADSATCAACLRELADPADRRYRYAFINCTNCGPRFTIVRDIPYDRPHTTMSAFAMCPRCAGEYQDPADRRFHAQPVCCPDCGPRLAILDAGGTPLTQADPVNTTTALLQRGLIVAVKGIGGYHLAVIAGNASAVAALRARKHREDKPFAVMVPDLAAARRLCDVDDAAERLLAGARRPIVLLPRLPGSAGPIAPDVAPGNRQLGLMLPYTPLHHLLLEAAAAPIVLTSGNVSDEPIVYRDEDAVDRLRGIADAYLVHDRAINVRVDDSVVRAWRGRETVLRRARGFAPEPIRVAHRFPRSVLACGAELKSTFCLAKDQHAFVSQHLGDLETAETLRSFTDAIAHFGRLFDIVPQVVAHDLHPEYLSTKYATDLAGVELVGVQHHHAHVASCMADNSEAGPVIGVAFDGTGYGTDGTIWGGELLIADLTGFERAGCLEPVPMPGGTAAIRQPWRMAAAYLAAAYPDGPPATLALRKRNAARWDAVLVMAQRGINSPITSSAGRLFDAVAALLGVRDEINYEGQAAIELEQLADPAEKGSYHAPLTGDAPLRMNGPELVAAAAEDIAAGTEPPVVAARFHNGLAAAVVAACDRLRDERGLNVVALSGGVFQNLLLTEKVVTGLEHARFRVLQHSRVPCNDGGISLGQAAVAAARDRQGRARPS